MHNAQFQYSDVIGRLGVQNADMQSNIQHWDFNVCISLY